MEKDFYIFLIYRELGGDVSAEEKKLLKEFLNSSSENEELYRDIKLSWELSDQTLDLDDINIEGDLNKLKKRMPQNMKESNVKVVSKRRFMALQAIVAILLLVSAGFLYRNFSNSDIELFADNENLEFELPDGSKGILRQGSKMIYKKSFLEDRFSTLIGTAKFKVTHDAARPFRVQVKNATIEVLGTEFSIAQAEDRLAVSVLSGRVSLTQNNETVILNKNEAGFCNSKASFPIKTSASSNNFLYWEKNQFRFEGQSLRSINQQLEMIFGIDIEISNSIMRECISSGVFNGNKPETILKSIAKKNKMKLVTISKKSFRLDEGNCD